MRIPPAGRLAAALLLLALPGSPPIRAQEQPTRWREASAAVGKLADEALRAAASGDREGLARLASTAEEDAVRVVFELHSRFVRAALADPAGGRPEIDAAIALAEASVPKRASPALAAACARWGGVAKEDLEREARLLAILPLVQAARARDPAGIRAAVDAADRDLRASTLSPAAAVLVHERAAALSALGLFRDATAAHRDSLDRDTAIGWLLGRGIALRWSASDLANLGELAAALRLRDEEIRQWKEADRPLDAWGARIDRGVALARSGFLVQAREALLAGVAESDAFGMPRASAYARSQFAQYLMRTGQGPEARALLVETRGLYLKAGMPAEAMACNLGIAACDAAAGRFADALASIDRCLAQSEKFGSALGSARTLALRARVFRLLGDPARAAEAGERAEALFHGIGASLDEAKAALERSAALRDAHLWPGAAMAAERAREIGDASGSGDILRPALVALAEARMGQGEFPAAEKALGRARETALEAGDAAVAAHALVSLALCLGRSGPAGPARAALDRARGECDALGDPALRVRLDLAGAEFALRAGDPATGAAAARSALEDLFSMERGLGDEESSGLLERGREAADAGMAACLRMGPEASEAAFGIAERGRAVVLARLLHGRRAILSTRIPGDLAEARRTATLQLAEASARLAETVGRGGKEAIAAARKDFEAAEARWRETGARTQREARSVAEVAEPPAPDLARVRAAIPEDAALVLYHLGRPVAGSPGRAAAVVLRREGNATLVDLGESRPLEERASAWLRQVSTDGAEDQVLAAGLYDALLRPLEPVLAGARRILVSPTETLHLLPFEALLRRDGEHGVRAIERWEFSYIPSGTVLAGLADEARGRVPGEGLLALADPAYPSEGPVGARAADDPGGVPRLAESGAEARAIAECFPAGGSVLLVREHATRTALVAALGATKGRLAAVHLACHGTLDPEHPALTGLVLAGGEILSLPDVYEMPVPADLVVLSGCRTAGGLVVSGEGVLGLVRGFFFAGCPRVVASSWEVPDSGTRVFMDAFYRGWRRSGVAPGAALRAVKLSSLRGGGPGAHPARWAAFTLWGLPE